MHTEGDVPLGHCHCVAMGLRESPTSPPGSLNLCVEGFEGSRVPIVLEKSVVPRYENQ